MSLIEAVLTYSAQGDAGPVPVARTSDPRVLRVLRECVLSEAAEEAERWRRIDPGVFAMRAAEAERLRRALDVLLPDTPVLAIVGDPGDNKGRDRG